MVEGRRALQDTDDRAELEIMMSYFSIVQLLLSLNDKKNEKTVTMSRISLTHPSRGKL
jgi:hypothetical protein